MQPDFEYDLKSEEYFSQLEERLSGHDTEDGRNLTEVSRELQFKKQQWLKRQQNPSSTTWHLVLLLGDGILLLTLLLGELVLILCSSFEISRTRQCQALMDMLCSVVLGFCRQCDSVTEHHPCIQSF